MPSQTKFSLKSALKASNLPQKNWYSCQEVAKILEVSPRTVLRFVEKKAFPVVRFSQQSWRVLADDLDHFLKDSYVPASNA